jgi:hypothetical protein
MPSPAGISKARFVNRCLAGLLILLLLGGTVSGRIADLRDLELDVQDITFFPAVVTEKRKVARMTFGVLNKGKEASGRFAVSFRVENAIHKEVITCRVVIDNVAPGKRELFTFYASVPENVRPDEIVLFVVEDYPGAEEGVPSFPAMDVEGLIFEPESPVADGSVVKIRCVLRNRSRKLDGMTWRIVDGEKRIVGDIEIPTLLSRETYFSRSFTWKAQNPGVHKIVLMLNPDPRRPDSVSGLILKIVDFEVRPAASTSSPGDAEPPRAQPSNP